MTVSTDDLGPDATATAPAASLTPAAEGAEVFIPIAIGISAAFLAWRLWASDRLSNENPRTPEEAKGVLARLWEIGRQAWLKFSEEPIARAYGVIPYKAATELAIDYATDLGQYINETSADALIKGFTAQINAGVGEGLAWRRSVAGYGLDPQQTQSYIINVMKTTPQYDSGPVPITTLQGVEDAILKRADRLGLNESHKAIQMGKNMVWLSMAASGDLPEGTKKRWITAEDERVCPVCAPLDQKVIPLHWRFKSGSQRFYAPGVHPNCRCTLELVYPEYSVDVVKSLVTQAGWDEYDRDQKGRFATTEQRHPEQKTPTVRLADLVSETPTHLSDLISETPVRLTDLITAPPVRLSDLISDQKGSEVTSGKHKDQWRPAEGLAPATTWLLANGFKPFDFINHAAIGKKIAIGAANEVSDDSNMWVSALDEEEEAPLTSIESFVHAFDKEAEFVGSQKINVQRGAHSGDTADFKQIAVGLDDLKYTRMRHAFAGLNKGQLMHIVTKAIDSSKNKAATLEFFDYNMNEKSYKKELEALDANEIASMIIWAEKAESDENFAAGNQHAGTAWTEITNMVMNIPLNQKMVVFGGLGSEEDMPARAIVFRFPYGFMYDGGSQVPRGGITKYEVQGNYVVDDINAINVPSDLRAKSGLHEDVLGAIDHIYVVDLMPDPDYYGEPDSSSYYAPIGRGFGEG